MLQPHPWVGVCNAKEAIIWVAISSAALKAQLGLNLRPGTASEFQNLPQALFEDA